MAESLPPMTLEELLAALENPHFSSYVYFGKEADKGWKVALAAQRYVPCLRVYRVSDSLKKDVRNKFDVTGAKSGVVFDFGTRVKATLTRTQTEKPLLVFDIIRGARAGA